jgi:Protein of unknown function (DUF3096)
MGHFVLLLASWKSDRLTEWRLEMMLGPPLQPWISLIAGILMLVVPRLLSYVVAGYLIMVGAIGLFYR